MKTTVLIFFLFIAFGSFSQDSVSAYHLVDIRKNNRIATAGFREVFIDHLNRKWFGSINAGVLMYDGRDFSRLTQQQGVSSNFVFRITEDSKKNIWLATFNGITCLQSDGKTVVNLKGNPGQNKFFTHVIEDSRGRVYAMGFAGLYLNRKSSWEKIDSVNKFLFALKGGKDTTWFLKEDATHITTSSDAVNPKFFRSTVTRSNYKLYLDSKKRLWVVALDGVGYFDGSSYVSVSNQLGFLSIAEFDGQIFLGSNGKGLFLWDGVNRSLKPVIGVKETAVGGLAAQGNGLWVAGHGFYLLEKAKIEPVQAPLIFKASSELICLSKEAYVYGRADKKIIYSFNGQEKIVANLSDKIEDNIVSAYSDKGVVYISTHYSLIRFVPETNRITNIKTPANKATYEYVTLNDTLFLGRDDGLFKLMGDTIIRIDFPELYKETPAISGLAQVDSSLLIMKPGVGLFEYKKGVFRKMNLPDAMLYQSPSSMTVIKDPAENLQYLLMLHSLGVDVCPINKDGRLGAWSIYDLQLNSDDWKSSGEFINNSNGIWYSAERNWYQFSTSIFRNQSPAWNYRIFAEADSLKTWQGWVNDVTNKYSFKLGQRALTFNWRVSSEYGTEKYFVRWKVVGGKDSIGGVNSDGTINHGFAEGGNYQIVYLLTDKLNNDVVKSLRLHIYIPSYWYEKNWGKVIIVFFFSLLLISATVFFIQRRNRKKIENLKRELEVINFRSKSLQNIIAPHLLFNLFNNVQAIINTGDKDSASQTLSTLSAFIRKSLEVSKSDLIPLSEELDLITQYAALEASRKTQFQYKFEIRNKSGLDLSEIEFPSMILQPLVENAIKFGEINNEIIVEVSSEEQSVRVIVFNSISKEPSSDYIGKGIGLSLIRDKLQLIREKYKQEYLFFYNRSNQGFKAEIIKTT